MSWTEPASTRPVRVVVAPAELSAQAATQLAEQLTAAAGGAEELVLDLSRTRLCDAAALQGLLDLVTRLAAEGTRVGVRSASHLLTALAVGVGVPVVPGGGCR